MNDAERPRSGLPCPHCGSSDAAGYVSPEENDAMYCFSCTKAWNGAASKEAPIEKAEEECPFEQPKDSRFVEGEHEPLPKRKVKESTCAFFDYRIGYSSKGEGLHVANYHSPKDSSLVGQQLRMANKEFVLINGKELSFFWAQHKFPKGKRVIITEGQIDAMTVWQSMGGTWPVVSLPHGVGSVKKTFKAQQEWLGQWEEVVLCFDMDEAGQEAVEEAVKYCPPGKVHVVQGLSEKDASDMVQKGKEGELKSALWKPRKWQPAALVDSKDVVSNFLTTHTMGTPWPWEGLNALTFGRHDGCVYSFAAAAGAGKSDTLLEVVYKDVSEGRKVGAIFLEEAPAEVKELAVSKLASKRLYYPDSGVSMEEKQEWEAKWATLPGSLLIYDVTKGEGTYDSVEPLVKHLIYAEGCTTIIFDSFSIAWDAAPTADETYRQTTVKSFTKLIKAARDEGVHGIVTSHLNKPPNTQQQHSEGAKIKQSNYYGSSALIKMCTFSFGLERNMESEDQDERNKATLRVVKSRKFGSACGKTVHLCYNPETGRLLEGNAPSEDSCPFDKPNEEF